MVGCWAVSSSNLAQPRGFGVTTSSRFDFHDTRARGKDRPPAQPTPSEMSLSMPTNRELWAVRKRGGSTQYHEMMAARRRSSDQHYHHGSGQCSHPGSGQQSKGSDRRDRGSDQHYRRGSGEHSKESYQRSRGLSFGQGATCRSGVTERPSVSGTLFTASIYEPELRRRREVKAHWLVQDGRDRMPQASEHGVLYNFKSERPRSAPAKRTAGTSSGAVPSALANAKPIENMFATLLTHGADKRSRRKRTARTPKGRHGSSTWTEQWGWGAPRSGAGVACVV